jgi:hypothetical protein
MIQDFFILESLKNIQQNKYLKCNNFIPVVYLNIGQSLSDQLLNLTSFHFG